MSSMSEGQGLLCSAELELLSKEFIFYRDSDYTQGREAMLAAGINPQEL